MGVSPLLKNEFGKYLLKIIALAGFVAALCEILPGLILAWQILFVLGITIMVGHFLWIAIKVEKVRIPWVLVIFTSTFCIAVVFVFLVHEFGHFPDSSENGGVINSVDTLNTNSRGEKAKPNKIDVAPEKTFTIFVDVSPDRAGAKVFVDGSLKGTAPCSVAVTRGVHHLMLEYYDGNSLSPLIYVDNLPVRNNDAIRVESHKFTTHERNQ